MAKFILLIFLIAVILAFGFWYAVGFVRRLFGVRTTKRKTTHNKRT